MSQTALRTVVVCEPVRTPVGRFGGVFRNVPAQQLAASAIRKLIDRTGIPEDGIDDVILGNCYPTMDSPAIGRVAALDAGLPVSVPGRQIDRRCGSGLQAVIDASNAVQTGGADLVIAGGVESMSRAPLYSNSIRWGTQGAISLHDSLERGRVVAGGIFHPVPGGMVETAENLAREFGITRLEQDQLALNSHLRAVCAQRAGDFDDELVSVEVVSQLGTVVVAQDEHPRPDISAEALSRLQTLMSEQRTDATVTAGNSSGQNDGAAVCIVTHESHAEKLGLQPLGKLVSWAVVGVDPERMGIGAVPATSLALARAGLSLRDIDLIELNEAFAAQVLSCARRWQLGNDDFARLNIHGSGISLGHPAGATGARILATLLRAMKRQDARYGLETMCIGGGQGLAAVFERM